MLKMKLQPIFQIKTEAAEGASNKQQHRVHLGAAVGPVNEAGRREHAGEIVFPDKTSG